MDQALINGMQAAYDFVWDRFGIYKGQIITGYAVIGAGYVLVNGLFSYFIVLIPLLLSGPLWTHVQKRSQVKSNLSADRFREHIIPKGIRKTVLLLTAFLILTAPWRIRYFMPEEYMNFVALYLFMYLATTYIRDRDPPEKRSLAWGV